MAIRQHHTIASAVDQGAHISIGLFFDISLPLYPRFMNKSPVHRINAYAKANATPEIASEANKGSPSLLQALMSTAMQAMDKMLSE